ncbi:hypothetical protein IAQ61_004366 [Plenodomus lingam]|uniref:uncharacterized protein n=1 Tax=Leptosphaeria maculans TaxID=5022 RepID=UPI00332D0828|nr:hypothetical protein IAQ61_004366 [Plenodomus lingam]
MACLGFAAHGFRAQSQLDLCYLPALGWDPYCKGDLPQRLLCKPSVKSPSLRGAAGGGEAFTISGPHINRRCSSMAAIKTDPSIGDSDHHERSGSESKSPLAQFGFFKSLTEKKTARDGTAPKRRGPKPDSKPALTRRQELNRQAQRTHRERKELYIKALEQEVLRLKDTFAATARERDAFAEENRKLRELLISHGISLDLLAPTNGMGPVGSSNYGSSTGSVSGYGPGSASTGYTSPPSVQHHASPPKGSASAKRIGL